MIILSVRHFPSPIRSDILYIIYTVWYSFIEYVMWFFPVCCETFSFCQILLRSFDRQWYNLSLSYFDGKNYFWIKKKFWRSKGDFLWNRWIVWITCNILWIIAIYRIIWYGRYHMNWMTLKWLHYIRMNESYDMGIPI